MAAAFGRVAFKARSSVAQPRLGFFPNGPGFATDAGSAKRQKGTGLGARRPGLHPKLTSSDHPYSPELEAKTASLSKLLLVLFT